MNRISSILFTAIVAIGLFSVIGVTAADRYLPGFSLPDKSYIEGSYLMRPGSLVEQSFADGSFQDSMEVFLSQRVPEYDSLLLMQAKLQRSAIWLAAVTFRYDAFHTYYGADRVAISSQKMLVDMPQSVPLNANPQEAFCEMLNESAKKHPNVRFVCDWLLKNNQTTDNPCYPLMNSKGLITEEWAYTHNLAPLDDQIEAFLDPLWNTDIKQPKYASDVHWRTERAAESYNKVAEILGLEPVDWSKVDSRVVVPAWTGNQGRFALDFDFLNSTIDDVRTFDSLTFHKLSSGKPLSAKKSGLRDSLLDGSISDEDAELLKHSGYSKYYGNGNAEIRNAGSNNGKTLLLIGDSFSYCLKRYYAMNYAKTIFIAPGNHKVKKTLDALIDEYEIDDVVIVMHCRKPDNIAQTSPSFLPVECLGEAQEEDDA